VSDLLAVCADPEGSPNDMFKELLKNTIESLVESCKAAYARLQDNDSIDAHTKPNQADVFLLNCLLDVWQPLSKQRSCAAHAAKLKQSIDAQVRPPNATSELNNCRLLCSAFTKTQKEILSQFTNHSGEAPCCSRDAEFSYCMLRFARSELTTAGQWGCGQLVDR
jgi:hypothetical protein